MTAGATTTGTMVPPRSEAIMTHAARAASPNERRRMTVCTGRSGQVSKSSRRPEVARGRARLLAVVFVAASVWIGPSVGAHGPGNAVTWNREIARIVFDKCASCHRPGGTSFPLVTFQDAQPLGTAIKDAVLARRMPPWGAVKGFGQFRNDHSLSQEQIELITKWVDGGIRRGNNPGLLPKLPAFFACRPVAAVRLGSPRDQRTVCRLADALVVDGLLPESVPDGRSFQIVARLPGRPRRAARLAAQLRQRNAHPFLFRRPLVLPAGTASRGFRRTRRSRCLSLS